MCVYLYVLLHTAHSMCVEVSGETTLESRSFLSTMWVKGIEPRLSGLVANTSTVAHMVCF